MHALWPMAVGVLACTGARPEAETDPTPHVELRLVSAVERLAPGETFILGAVLDLDPGWHVYWHSPGDAGLATKARFSGPEGFTFAEVAYPGPERFVSPGDIESYGYSEEVALITRAKAPEGGGGGRFTAAASWLVCAEICIRGKDEASLELPAGGEGGAGSEGELAAHLARLPRPWPTLEGARYAWRSGEQPVLDVSVPGATGLSLFPHAEQPAVLLAQAPSNDGARLEATFRPRAGDSPAMGLRATLRVTRDDRPTYLEMDLPWPPPAAATKEIP